jgi:predicted alpha/beta-fold hydrolase
MPLVKSNYDCVRYFKNGHIQTILPWLLRTPPEKHFGDKVLIDTPDGEQLTTLHFKNKDCKRLIIVTHGLEGNAEDTYILHLANNLFKNDSDVVTWTMRTCDNNIIHKNKFYNGADYSDLQFIIDTYQKNYDEIYLVGISLGGSITCNYLGREANNIHPKIQGAFAISTPVDLESSSKALESKFSKYLYQGVFVRSMKKKVLKKAKTLRFPLDIKAIKKARLISDFDDHIVGPMYGYKSGQDYRIKGSSLPYLKNISVPLYILNALDDPFLGEKCYPTDLAEQSDLLFLETPKAGGHVGFIRRSHEDLYWYESRILQFINGQI